MRAVLVEAFGVEPRVADVPEPTCPPDGAVVRVAATGLCRSDWHGWMGHDPDVTLPHVPGHEFAGEIVEVGREVTRRRTGERVTAPFVYACGRCPSCLRENEQICENQQQPGFTHWGSYAEYVVIDNADVNAVPLPDALDLDVAAALGCRFATAYRAVIAQGGITGDDEVMIIGCGGVGLSAVMIAVAQGARVIAVDPGDRARERALALGAVVAFDPIEAAECADRVSVSIDAVGGAESLALGVRSLRPGGRHVQVGLLGGVDTLPASIIGAAVARELELVGSHGMAARDYPAMLERVSSGEFDLARLVRDRVPLGEGAARLAQLAGAEVDGMTLLVP